MVTPLMVMKSPGHWETPSGHWRVVRSGSRGSRWRVYIKSECVCCYPTLKAAIAAILKREGRDGMLRP